MRIRFFQNRVQLFLLFLMSLVLFSCTKKAMPPQTRIVMNTVCSVNAYFDGTDALYSEIFSRLFDIETVFSATISTSELSEINRCAGEKGVLASDEMIYVLDVALKIARLTNGAFNPALNPLISLWGVNTDSAHVPSSEEMYAVFPLVDFSDVLIDGKTVFLAKKGMSLNLGGIVKGYAADCVVEILKAHAVKKAVVDLGGNISVYGEKANGEKWTVGVKNPFDKNAPPLVRLSVFETSVVTSGAYQRFFKKDGTLYHHIIDAKTGFPAKTGLASTTVIAPLSIVADGLSTAAFVLGEERTLALKDDFEKSFGIAIDFVFIRDDMSVSFSDGIEDAVAVMKKDR